jgi:hypothetical protein
LTKALVQRCMPKGADVQRCMPKGAEGWCLAGPQPLVIHTRAWAACINQQQQQQHWLVASKCDHVPPGRVTVCLQTV